MTPAPPARLQALTVGRLRVRGGGEASALRQRVTAALAGEDLLPPGWPRQSIVVLRRVSDPLPGALFRRRGEGVSAWERSLRSSVAALLRDAVRPARGPVPAGANAVVFADFAELAACLIHDWLGGAAASHWWWRDVLRGLPAAQWVQVKLLPQGDLLPAVIEQLAARGDAVPWVCRLSEDQARHALAAVAQAHELALPRAPPTRSAADLRDRAQRDDAGDAPIFASASAAAQAAADLSALVPEIRSAGLTAAQLGLLAVSLALRRAPQQARSPGFLAAAMQLDAAMPGAPGGDHRPDSVPSPPPSRMHQDHESPAPTALPALPDGGAESASLLPALVPASRIAGTIASTIAGATPTRDPIAAPDAPPPGVAIAASAVEAISPPAPPPLVVSQRIAEAEPSARAQPAPDIAPLIAVVADTVPPAPAVSRPIAPDAAFTTAFGGLFYLLNVALALGLYGDFTAPRRRGLALSPWDWLALIGRHWFGAEIEADPLWPALAQLAGRAPGAPPGAGFRPPRRWKIPREWLAPFGPATELRAARGRMRNPESLVVVARAARRGGESRALQRWLLQIAGYLQARLALALETTDRRGVGALVCRHQAVVAQSPSTISLTFSLAQLPLAIRCAGLDRDPGWIPAAGRSVFFHYT